MSAAVSLRIGRGRRRVRVRGDLALDIGRNVVHGSDSVEAADREISIYFNKDEIVEWTPAAAKWVTE